MIATPTPPPDLPLAYQTDEMSRPRLFGRCLDGRFTILEPLGAGAMGTVYRAIQHPFGREVAVKVLDPHLAAANPYLVRRFLREARLAGRIAHPNVMAVLDMGQTPDGIFYLVAELLRGQTLADTIAREGALSAARTIRIGVQLCAALAAAHELDIVHRDLKPANVMVLEGEDDAVRVLDFGVAKSLAALRSGTQITELRGPIGTPAYMAPEIALGRDAAARADLYSLGVVLYEMITGELPFRGTSAAEVMALHVIQEPPRLAGRCPGPLATLIVDLLAKDPGQRPPSALRVLDALLELESPGTTTLPWTRRAACQ